MLPKENVSWPTRLRFTSWGFFLGLVIFVCRLVFLMGRDYGRKQVM